MNKKLLIISPYFPPTNAADMQRVRISLPYFANYGWDAEVVTVDTKYSDMATDALLMQSIPGTIKIHKVRALTKKWTSKIGLGSLALRSLWFYRQKVNSLLKTNKYDLIYFSTTQFPICILGAYWKNRFNIPYVIDMQDPWHSEYYRDKPKEQQPAKYWFSYRLNKYLEPIAMKNVAGLISVSAAYITDLKKRYPYIKDIPAETITFGAFEPDFEIAANNKQHFPDLLDPDFVNIVYIGRGGNDMLLAITPVFKAMAEGLVKDHQIFSKLKFYFLGTSYAAAGSGRQTIMPLAKQYGLANYVVETPQRISYYHTLHTLQQADALFIPGSDDARYTASKIYPYLLTQKPLLAILHPNSSAVNIIKQCATGANVLTFAEAEGDVNLDLYQLLKNWGNYQLASIQLTEQIALYSAKTLTAKQCELFEQVLNNLQ